MRLRERDKRQVTVYAPAGAQDDAYVFAHTTVIRAAVYPMGETLDSQVYGETARDRRLMLYDGKETLCVGMGVSLDGGAPTFRIVSLEAHSHKTAILERIDEGRAG